MTAVPGPQSPPTSGIPGLDEVFTGLRYGDSVVWRVEGVEDYVPVCTALATGAQAAGQPMLYLHFTGSPSLLAELEPDLNGISVCERDPDAGFEQLLSGFYAAVRAAPRQSVVILDPLTDLSDRYLSDRMIGNFYAILGEEMSDRDCLSYASIIRYYHSHHATSAILNTASLVVDTYRYRERHYVRVEKSRGRRIDRRLVLHQIHQGRAHEVRDSPSIARVVTSSPWAGLPSASYRMVGVWDRLFLEAEVVAEGFERGRRSTEEVEEMKERLVRLIISRESRMAAMARDWFSLRDLIRIWKRMIGTGQIGGKAVGMLLARAILGEGDPAETDEPSHGESESGVAWLEPHDSFFIGSDVFYTYLVMNRAWWGRHRETDPATRGDEATSVRHRLLSGSFPDYIVERFRDMLDYYGHSPLVVRSSSLLEDAFGNAFAGKYDSIFCSSAGSASQRLEDFLDAVRRVYASTLSSEALAYRRDRGLLEQDEQMALLVQRVSGSPVGNWYFPHLAGVGFSYNPYAWHPDIDPRAGMLRTVFGLGTRAVDRQDADYTHVIALNAPSRRPDVGAAAASRAQRKVDALHLHRGGVEQVDFQDLLAEVGAAALPLPRVAESVRAVESSGTRGLAAGGSGGPSARRWFLTLAGMVEDAALIARFRDALGRLRDAYGTEVDVEFTVNYGSGGETTISIVQCRPLQVRGMDARPVPLPHVPPERIVLRTTRGVIGHSRELRPDRILLIEPQAFAALGTRERHELASVVGEAVNAMALDGTLMLIGPGRWGTSSPELGVPVRFSQIRGASILCELDAIHDGLVADLSLGTHFFHEMVEHRLLYLAVHVSTDASVWNPGAILARENLLPKLLPERADWAELVHVCAGSDLVLNANSRDQLALLWHP